MGSFNVACGLSHVTIHPGDRAVFVPLEPSWSAEFLSHQCCYYVTNDGAYALWQPVTLPIHGVYEDYGRLGDVVEDSHTCAIEKYFGTTIQEFLEIFGGEGSPNDKFPAKMAGMFIHGDIYDQFAKSLRGEWSPNDRSVFKGAMLTDYVLKRLGFEEVDEKLSDERYNRKFVWPGNDKFYLGSDGRWVRFHTKKKKNPETPYRIEQLAKTCAGFGVDLDIEGLDQVSEAQWLWDEARDGLVEVDKAESEEVDSGDEHASELKWLRGFLAKEKITNATGRMLLGPRPVGEKPFGMIDIYGELWRNNDLTIRDHMVGWHNVYLSFVYCNQLIQPSWNGPQFGCDTYTFELAKAVVNLTSARITERKKQEEEDELIHQEWLKKKAKKTKTKKKAAKKSSKK